MTAKGGARAGAGRKTKAQEQKAAERIKKALRTIYKKDDDDDAINSFLVVFGDTKDGMKFFAEHLLGKAPDKIEFEDVTEKLTIQEKRELIDKFKKKVNDK